jgi:hypothetical protein
MSSLILALKAKYFDSFASCKVTLAFLAACAAGFYYLTIGSTHQAHRYISEIVSPVIHPDADLSELSRIDPGHNDFSAYRVSDDTHLYTELNTPYAKSRLLPVIGLPTLGQIRYGGGKSGSSRAMLFDTRMLATHKNTPEQCTQHLATFGPELSDALNDKPWPLAFALRTSEANAPISSIESTTFTGFSPPRMFALCTGSIFVFVTTQDH